MQHITIAALIVLSAGAVCAEPFGYQQQAGSSELDPGIWEGPVLTIRPFVASNITPSEFALYASEDIDGSARFAYVGQIVPSADTGISSYEQTME